MHAEFPRQYLAELWKASHTGPQAWTVFYCSRQFLRLLATTVRHRARFAAALGGCVKWTGGYYAPPCAGRGEPPTPGPADPRVRRARGRGPGPGTEGFVFLADLDIKRTGGITLRRSGVAEMAAPTFAHLTRRTG